MAHVSYQNAYNVRANGNMQEFSKNLQPMKNGSTMTTNPVILTELTAVKHIRQTLLFKK